jgi:hypothetical protein
VIRWLVWMYCLGAYTTAMRRDYLGGLAVVYQDRVDRIYTKADKRARQHGFDPSVARDAAWAMVEGSYGDWRSAHGLGLLGAPA